MPPLILFIAHRLITQSFLRLSFLLCFFMSLRVLFVEINDSNLIDGTNANNFCVVNKANSTVKPYGIKSQELPLGRGSSCGRGHILSCYTIIKIFGFVPMV